VFVCPKCSVRIVYGVKMRILQVCPRYPPSIGGVEEHVKNISERLAKNCDVTVFTADRSPELPKSQIVNGVEVRRFNSWAPNEAYYLSRDLPSELRKASSNYDVVHSHSYHAFPALYAAQAKGNNKIVFTPHYHGFGHTVFRNLLHIPYKFFGKKIFEKADMVTCVSDYEKRLVTSNFKINDEKVMVIPNGVTLGEFQGLQKRRNYYKLILYVGRLETYKGVHHLINAFSKLHDDTILEIVGKGPCKKSLVTLTEKLGITSRIRFYQDLPREELLQKYVDANLFVLLSKHEAYGISVAEALASGTPCIVANTSALAEWIDNENCFGIDYPIDSDELATLMTNTLKRNVSVTKLLDWNEVVDSLVKTYKCICT